MTSVQAHKLLELPLGASREDIKRSFRRLSLKYHPDKNRSPGAEERFKEISAAYDLLYDNGYRDVGEVIAKRVAKAVPTSDVVGKAAADEFNKQPDATENGIFGVFNFGGDLFKQIVDAAKNKDKNQK